MTTLESQAQQYLFNLNSITRKIHQDVKILHRSQNENWDDLDFDTQEALLDSFFVDQAVQEKYAVDSTDGADQPVVFPKYTVNCGEKIIIDFDNDGWTWRDEHSGPFSWMSRSQQDLSILEDEEDEGIEKDKKSEQKRKRIQKSRSPERSDHGSGDLAFKPEKSIWESPFLAADRGLDSAYPSSHASEQSRTSDESDDLSQKLAASLSVSIDEDVVDSQLNSPSTHADTTILLDSGHQKMIDVASARLDLSRKGSGSCSSSEDTCSLTSRGSGGSGKRKKDSGSLVNKKLWNPLKKDSNKKKEAELNLITDQDSVRGGPDSGQVSPVYLEEPGESSSDLVPTSASTTQSSMTTFTFSSSAREELAPEEEEPRPSGAAVIQTSSIDAQGNEALNDSFQNSEDSEWNSELFSNTTTTDELTTSKTGFDFLDNW